jgi:hypothetical protein
MSTQTDADAEAAWFTATDPKPMFALLRGKERGRRFRLFACACCWRVDHLLTDDRSRQALELMERFLDGEASRHDYALGETMAADAYTAQARVIGGREAGRRSSEADGVRMMASVFAAQAVTDCFGNVADAAGDCRGALRGYATADLSDETQMRETGDRIEAAERSAQAALLREIFGNPFQSEPFQSEWRTKTVLDLASRIYASRDFESMPILADALQDAGCENERILSHCRYSSLTAADPGRGGRTSSHVRGCWVVDLILGRK